jgi:hypothetical protein
MAKELYDINGLQTPFTLNRDLSPYDMPPQYFSDGENIQFTRKGAGSCLGHLQVLGTPTATPYWAISWDKGGTDLWIYGTLTNLYKISGVTHSSVTRSSGAYTTLSGTTKNWSGGILGGVLVVTNGIDVPQSFTQGGSLFTDLPQWPSTLLCQTIVPFKNHLVALNLTDNGTAYPFSLRWSDAIPEGAIDNGTNTWNTASTSSEAAQVTLGGTPGHILNAKQLGNELIIYKEDSVYSLTYVGGSYTFNVKEKFKDTGLFSKFAVVDLGDNRHAMLSTNDFVIHNGNSLKSAITDQMKAFLFGEIDSTYYYKTFLAHNKNNSEVWICYPQTGATNGFPNKALVWNYVDNTWAVRDLPSCSFIAKGLVNPNLTNTWSASSDTWNTNIVNWARPEFNPAVESLLVCGTNDTKFYLEDKSLTFDGTSFTKRLERYGLHAGRSTQTKKVTKLIPRFEGTGSIQISVGAENDPYEGITYANPVTFTIGEDYKVDCRVRGRYIAVKFESTTDNEFRLSGYTFETEVASDR